MPDYYAPGVYVVEVQSGPRPIQAVGTSTAGFVGEAPAADRHVNQAIALTNWSQFVKEFMTESSPGTPLAQAVYGFFENGGRRCYVVNVAKDQPLAGDARKRQGLDVLKTVDDVAIVAAPGYCDAASYEALLSHCEALEDRVAILDPPEDVASIDQLVMPGTADEPRNAPREGSSPGNASRGLRPRRSTYGTFYFPRIRVRNPFSGSSDPVTIAPSGHIAGVWARTDATRGVHKAPANEPIRGALGVAFSVTQSDQESLNQNGVNCIRYFSTEGIQVWGARTLAEGSSPWRYLNVRRLFNMVEKSIGRSTRWCVFEPNDELLWKSITRDVTAFLTLCWRDGALLGRTPGDAFFVKCDEETNPPESIDAGRVVTLVGMAPVKPAEFIVFRIGQHVGGVEIQTQGGANA